MKSYRRLERFLFITGLVMLLVSILVRVHGIVMARAAVWSFEANQSSKPSTSSTADPAGGNPDASSINFGLWSAQRIRAYEAALGMKLDAPLAVLTIPKVGLEVPVFDGTDDLILNRGTGRIAGTAMPGEPGNIGIAGHRDGFFRSLKELHVGDQIELAADSGEFRYKVDDIQIVQPSDISVLQSGSHSSLTLVTCYPFYFVGDAPQRYIVHASMVDSDKTATSRSDSAIQKVRKEHTQ